MEEQQVVEYFKALFGPGIVVVGWYLGRVLVKLSARIIPIVMDLITEMKMLRASIDDLKKLGPRVDKLEIDMDEGFKRIRELHKNNGVAP
jgi:hypothetical protein